MARWKEPKHSYGTAHKLEGKCANAITLKLEWPDERSQNTVMEQHIN